MASTLALFLTSAGTGLLAGGASCAAVQGGLLAGAVGRRTAPHTTRPARGATTRQQATEPLAPVGAFLAGKLLSHTLLGTLLGVFGAALQPSPRTRAVLLIAAALVMLLFALDLMGVKAVARLVPRPPAAFGQLVRRKSKSGAKLAPALLGFATVLIPCGVTLSVELVAITSGSAVAGAAVMAGFVLGTAPLFAVLGYVFRQAGQAFSGRLGIVTGLVVLAVALWTAVSGLQAGGWYTTVDTTTTPAAAAEPQPGRSAKPDMPALQGPVTIDAAGKQTIVLTVTDFYEPTGFTARAGAPTTLILRGKDSGGCARAFTIPELGVQEIAKRDGDTRIDLGTRKPGKLLFSCAMGMQGGAIDFKEGAA
ncbi:sulfite exporter TauE/SafE family protein [Streptomyces sp. NBC_00059]|uniref:urease accessory protein UreH domain-containing protein n=1 Tax=Streptomyces sp. NBC_00059 TaxID=2975635 RepID=UPI002253FD20|nr:sulfite exporter TauE/SafE family protein [Streptomyces sp. NBC_00059]MCX5418038.1 sulfite exporter TauE/SafE family protein [Streptomyces sp. NBC_00059]